MPGLVASSGHSAMVLEHVVFRMVELLPCDCAHAVLMLAVLFFAILARILVVWTFVVLLVLNRVNFVPSFPP